MLKKDDVHPGETGELKKEPGPVGLFPGIIQPEGLHHRRRSGGI